MFKVEHTFVNLPMKISMSYELLKELRKLGNAIHTEYAFYLNEFDIINDDSDIYITIPYQEIIIPKQQVSIAEVTVKENIFARISGHKHPDSVTHFSNTDLNGIAVNSQISLLLCNNKIVRALVKIADNSLFGSIFTETEDITYYKEKGVDTSINADKVDELKDKIDIITPKYTRYDYIGLP